MAQKFLRRDSTKYSKLGKRRKKKQVWRRPTGRDNKMRERIKGHPVSVKVGYKTDKKIRGTIQNKIPKIIKNLRDLQDIQKNQIAIVGKIGKKKKIEIAKKAEEKKIIILNLNTKKFLEKTRRKNESKKEKNTR